MPEAHRPTLFTLLCVAVALLAGGCGADQKLSKRNYSLVITGSVSPRPVTFSGSFQYLNNNQRVTRDLSGSGSFVASFFADELVYVRVNRTSEYGFYTLKVTRDGELEFESPATIEKRPLVYAPAE